MLLSCITDIIMVVWCATCDKRRFEYIEGVKDKFRNRKTFKFVTLSRKTLLLLLLLLLVVVVVVIVVVVVVVAVAVAVAVAVVVVAVCYYIFALEKNYDFMPIKTNINTTFKVIFCGDELLCTVYENKV